MDTLIVSGGDIDTVFLQEYCKKHKNKVIIAVDKGLEALYSLNILPSHIVGDLDSVSAKIIECYQKNSQVTIHQYLPEKDYTDTDIALKLAITLHSSHITLIGALGKRMDHALSNIHILTYALKQHISCEILDKNNRIYLINTSMTLEKSKIYGKYISLIPLTSTVEGITLTGFKYPLMDATLTIGKSLGVSNEMTGNRSRIDLKSGILIVIESKD